MTLLQIVFIVVSFGLCFLSGLLSGIRWEKRRAKRIQDQIRLTLINANFGMSLLPGETVDQLSKRVTDWIRDPFKHARENPAWIKKDI